MAQPIPVTRIALQSEKTVAAYLKSKQLLSFCFARQDTLQPVSRSHGNIVYSSLC